MNILWTSFNVIQAYSGVYPDYDEKTDRNSNVQLIAIDCMIQTYQGKMITIDNIFQEVQRQNANNC